jgi:hypothetical protein
MQSRDDLCFDKKLYLDAYSSALDKSIADLESGLSIVVAPNPEIQLDTITQINNSIKRFKNMREKVNTIKLVDYSEADGICPTALLVVGKEPEPYTEIEYMFIFPFEQVIPLEVVANGIAVTAVTTSASWITRTEGNRSLVTPLIGRRVRDRLTDIDENGWEETFTILCAW